MKITHTTDEVYGISRDLPLNYVGRDSIDQKLVDNLTRENHIVIYGSSKQGKTSLRKHCLSDADYVVVQCSNKWDLSALHEAILKRTGFQLVTSTKRTISGKLKLLASFSAKLLGTGGTVGGEAEGQAARETTTAPLEIDPADVNDVIAALKSIGFSKYIVLEDFHYLPIPTQKDFAVALKAFHEVSKLCFIVVGVWLEENRLVVYNGDLTGRVVPIDADRWTSEELLQVIDKGASLLNITFPESVKYHLLADSYSSVYIVQEACRRICRASRVFETQQQLREVGEGIDTGRIVADIVNEQSARYNSFIHQFADGFQESEYKMYRWLLLPVLTADPKELQRGITYSQMGKVIRQYHPMKSTLNLGNLTIALQSVAALQVKKDIKPIILDYDETNRRLSVVDRGLLIWLAKQDRREILETAGFEPETIDAVLKGASGVK